MKFKIGELVREGGPKGPISRIISFKDGVYVVSSLNGMATGYISEDMLYKFRSFEQLTLF